MCSGSLVRILFSLFLWGKNPSPGFLQLCAKREVFSCACENKICSFVSFVSHTFCKNFKKNFKILFQNHWKHSCLHIELKADNSVFTLGHFQLGTSNNFNILGGNKTSFPTCHAFLWKFAVGLRVLCPAASPERGPQPLRGPCGGAG